MSETIKLHAFIAQSGYTSRRKAEELIIDGKVTVNDEPAKLGQRIDPEVDLVRINDQPLTINHTLRYFLIYKPVGVLSTTNDDLGRRTVLSLIPKIKERVYPVGRLDQDSEGLMILTNDGKFTQNLTHPSKNMNKVYQILVAGKPTEKALNQLQTGVKLKEGYTDPAEVEILDTNEDGNTWLTITIHQGWNRQVRRMLERVGYETLQLIRTDLGPFNLDMLGEKQYLELSTEKIEELMNMKNEV